MRRFGIRPGRAALAIAIVAYVVGIVVALGGVGLGTSRASADNEYQ